MVLKLWKSLVSPKKSWQDIVQCFAHTFSETQHILSHIQITFQSYEIPFFRHWKTLYSLETESWKLQAFQLHSFKIDILALIFLHIILWSVWNLESADRFWSLLCVWKLTFTHPQTRARHTAAGCTRIWSCENVLCVFQACSEFRVFEGRRGTGGEEEQRRPVHHGCTCREGVGVGGAGLTVLGQSQKLLGDWQTAQPMTVTSRRHDIMRAFSVPPRLSSCSLFVNSILCVWQLAPFISPYHIKPATQYFER